MVAMWLYCPQDENGIDENHAGRIDGDARM